LKELNKGWIIPLLPTDARLLPNATISPMGVVSQSTINDRGEIIPSNRVTHDLSFLGKSSKLSINSRTNMDLLEPCQYGHMLLRVIHYIVALRICYPNLPIVLQKTDFKSAYRRQQLSAKTASQCLSSVKINGEQFVLLNMRLSFGGSACPSEWCLISESITDLANRILEDDSWNPNELPPKLLNKLPPTEILDNSIPFANAKPLLVDIPLEKFGKSDVYIDDVCTVGVLRDGKDELRLKSSVLLAMDVFGRPIHKKEPLPRDPLPSMDKLLSEGGLSEEKCLLGWILDTRRLRIKLHPEKFLHWSSQIKDLVSSGGQTSKKVLEVIIGRLNHAASILPMSRHFLSRITFIAAKACYYKKIFLKQQLLEDLQLWLKILEKLKEGISMNLLTFRPPDIYIWTDACEFGIGGYSSPRGRAWSWPIPIELQHRAHINLLEFIAATTGIWIEIMEGGVEPQDCILAFGDNTSAMGWLNKSKYRNEYDDEFSTNARLRIARQLASLIIENELRLFSQWFPGEHNCVADILSRNPYEKHEILTETLRSQFSKQVPQDFRISVIPTEIESFIYNLLSQLTKPHQQLQSTNNLNQQCGENGHHSSIQSESEMTTFLNHSHLEDTEPKSLAFLHNISGTNEMQKEQLEWLRDQSKIPSACWLRPSWKTAFQIHD
jgi:hypothetical protein